MRHPGDAFEAESRLALVVEALAGGLRELPARDGAPRDPGTAGILRELLDVHVVTGITLQRAAAQIGAHPTHLIRAFQHRYGIAPHRYLTSRRLDRARKALLDGDRPARVAVEVGFHDQAHLTRHFVRLLGVTPGAYAAGGKARP